MTHHSKIWACTGCGSVFTPGWGPDTIMADDDPDSAFDAYRDGECPSCGELNPPMEAVQLRGGIRP